MTLILLATAVFVLALAQLGTYLILLDMQRAIREIHSLAVPTPHETRRNIQEKPH